MFLRPVTRVIAALFLSLLVALIGFAQTPAVDGPPGLQMEFPAGGRLRIENQLGNVTAEVWNQKHVFVSASGEAGVSRLSSVVIENGSQGFVIRVTRRLGAPNAPVDLSVKFPDTARVEIQTGSGQVTLRGLPASTTVKSIAGDVNVELPESASLDIAARANKGTVKSELPQPLSENGHVLKAKLGDGTQSLNLNSETGNITLSLLKDFGDRAGRNTPEPALTDVPTKGAGTPAPVLDAQDVDEDDVVRVDSQLATLNLSVIDRDTNRGVVGLAQSDFRLFENGAQQQILQFDSSSAPFDLLLVIDLSGSTRDVLKLIRAAALRFVAAARSSDRIGVITFAGQARLISPLTLDRQTLHERISVMDTASGDTKLYDALDFAVSEAEKNAKSRRRTAIIVMSDGLDASMPGVARGANDVGSRLSYKDLRSRVGEFDGVLYTLWLNTEYEALNPHDTQPEAFDAGHDRMKETADIGGGIFYEVERLEDLAGAYERVVADLGTVYSLAYRPSDKTRDRKWRAIRVNVVTRPSAIARGKRGYYAN
ncbi:MAG TPA: VWA domain-containing protein [Pyrinomonadaceae bacterium]|nr:VWA domain-containing protein [Pyrinomonadaceae bacterium]